MKKVIEYILWVVLVIGIFLVFIYQPRELFAQTLDNQEIQQEKIVATPIAPLQIPENDALEFDLKLVKIPGLNSDDSKGIKAKGYTRYITHEGKKIGQVVLSGLEKNGQSVPLDTTKFNSQFDIEDDDAILNNQSELKINGNPQELMSAIQQLKQLIAQNEGGAEKAREKEKEIKQDAQSKDASSSSPAGNDQADAYQTPERLAVEEEKEPTIDVRVTTDGCNIIPDYAQEVGIQQSKTQTFENGALKSEEDCSNSLTKYPLKKNFSLCADTADYQTYKIKLHYQYYYVEPKTLTPKNIGECKTADEYVYDISPNYNCQIHTDFSKGEAQKQVELGYTGVIGYVKLKDCSPSPFDVAVAMTLWKSDCAIVDDFNAEKSSQPLAWTYEQDGLTYKATQCFIDEKQKNKYEYPHIKKYYAKNGDLICKSIPTNNAITIQYKTFILVNDIEMLRRDCVPDGQSMSLTSTTEGCTNPALWEHDFTNNVSYGQERFYFVKDAKKVYATLCLKSTKQYPHRTKTNRYVHDDNLKFSYRYVDIYIEDANFHSGTYDIKINFLPSGATQLPYTYVKTADAPNGQVRYAGCTKYIQTSRSEIYERIDKSEYTKAIGAGSEQSGIYSCSVTSQPQWTKSHTAQDIISGSGSYSNAPHKANSRQYCTYYDSDRGICQSYGNEYQLRCQYRKKITYRGIRQLTRDDGTIINQNSQNSHIVAFVQNSNLYRSGTWSSAWIGNSTYCTNYSNYGWSWSNISEPSPYTGSEVASWNSAEGW